MEETKEQQLFFMNLAISLGKKGRIEAPPNPWVGCVIVKKGEIVGQGYHVAFGQAHAEIMALNEAKTLAKGATAYITLEPCSHYGKTPPCVEALIESGIKHVVIPFLDPDPLVQGKGVEVLKKNGVKVTVAIGEEEARRSLEPYLFHRKHRRPFCVLKAASSIDGKIASKDGSSQWISGEEARANAHLLRAESQAILIGTKTALIDKPKLTVRKISTSRQPLRVVLDAHGKIPLDHPLFEQSEAKTLVFTSSLCDDAHLKEWEKRHIEFEKIPFSNNQMNLVKILEILGSKGIIQLLVEGGSTLQTSFIEQRLAERFVLFMGSCLLGQEGKPLFSFSGPPSIQEAPRWTLTEVARFQNDVRLDFKI